MRDKKLIIFGKGNFADFIAYSFVNKSNYELIAFCVENKYWTSKKNEEFGVPIVNYENVEDVYSPEDHHIFIAIGHAELRARILKLAQQKGFQPASFLSPDAVIAENVSLGRHLFIGEGSFIQAFVTIDTNSILIAVKIGHHSRIGENCLLSVCLVGADVTIGNNTFIGLNASIRPKVSIADKNIIGMGCSIIKNTKTQEVYSAPVPRKRNLKYDDIADSFL